MSAIWFAALNRDELLQARRLRDELSVADLPRVNAVALGDGGPVTVSFEFEALDDRLLVSGTVAGRLFVRCERCLERMRIDIDSDVAVALTELEPAGEQPDDYEPVVMTDGTVRLFELVEDEILLAVPLVARHELGQCGALAERLEQLRAQAASEATTSPFAGLDALLRDKRN